MMGRARHAAAVKKATRMDDPKAEQDSSGRLLTVAAFAIVLVLLVGGFLLFPRLQQVIGFQDCVATGRTDC